MPKQNMRRVIWIALAVVCFVMAGLSFTGVVLRQDTTNSKLMFGIIWTLVGVSWLGRYFAEKKKQEQREGPEDK